MCRFRSLVRVWLTPTCLTHDTKKRRLSFVVWFFPNPKHKMPSWSKSYGPSYVLLCWGQWNKLSLPRPVGMHYFFTHLYVTAIGLRVATLVLVGLYCLLYHGHTRATTFIQNDNDRCGKSKSGPGYQWAKKNENWKLKIESTMIGKLCNRSPFDSPLDVRFHSLILGRPERFPFFLLLPKIK